MDEEQEMTSFSGCLFRLFWIFVGPAVLLLLAIIIAVNQTFFLGITDIIYGVILILTIVTRLVDKPQPDASPSERRAVKLYITIFPVAAIALWLLAHFVLRKLF